MSSQFKIGDHVYYENPHGVKFELIIWKIQDEKIYAFHDCFWYPTDTSRMTLLPSEFPTELDEYTQWKYRKLIEMQPSSIKDMDWFALSLIDEGKYKEYLQGIL